MRRSCTTLTYCRRFCRGTIGILCFPVSLLGQTWRGRGSPIEPRFSAPTVAGSAIPPINLVRSRAGLSSTDPSQFNAPRLSPRSSVDAATRLDRQYPKESVAPPASRLVVYLRPSPQAADHTRCFAKILLVIYAQPLIIIIIILLLLTRKELPPFVRKYRIICSNST
jgi:hypothetical protein